MIPETADILNRPSYHIKYQIGLLKENFVVEDGNLNLLHRATAPIAIIKAFHIYSGAKSTMELLALKLHKLIEIFAGIIIANKALTETKSHDCATRSFDASPVNCL